MNSKLYDTSVGEMVIPKDIKQHLRNSFAQAQGANQNTEGFRRNQELQSQEKITYKQLKRIKNFFDNFKGESTESSFILNGGALVKNWVNNSLKLDARYNKLKPEITNKIQNPRTRKSIQMT